MSHRSWRALLALLSILATHCTGTLEDGSPPSEPGASTPPPPVLEVPAPADPDGRPARAVPGGAVLDGFGGIHTFGAFALDTTNAPYWKDWDIARALVLLPDGKGGWTLDGFGGVHAFGKAPTTTTGPYWPGEDRARALVVLADHLSGYLLEGSGAVHAFGPSAPTLAGAPSFDKDIARGLEIHFGEDGVADGGWVLDGYGGLHAFGKAPAADKLPYYLGYDFWQRLHKVEGGFWAVGRFGVIQPVGVPAGVALDGIADWAAWDIARDIVPVGATKPAPFDASRSLRCAEAGRDYCGFEGGIRGLKLLSFHCATAGEAPESVKLCWYGCEGGVCNAPPPPPPPPTGLKCENLQWWNSALTSSSKPGWWDTDLAVSSGTPVVLRHDSRLDGTGVYEWGYMPEFTDLATGKPFKFLHLRPSSQWATEIGKVYPAGYVVGLSGGDTYDTGKPKWSTGAHLCVQTIDSYRDVFPTGDDACL
jgi:hypothetical protein